MTENNRNQEQNQSSNTGSSNQSNQNTGQSGQTRNTSGQDQQFQNPQRGDDWNNYRSREMSDEGYQKDNIGESGE